MIPVVSLSYTRSISLFLCRILLLLSFGTCFWTLLPGNHTKERILIMYHYRPLPASRNSVMLSISGTPTSSLLWFPLTSLSTRTNQPLSKGRRSLWGPLTSSMIMGNPTKKMTCWLSLLRLQEASLNPGSGEKRRIQEGNSDGLNPMKSSKETLKDSGRTSQQQISRWIGINSDL